MQKITSTYLKIGSLPLFKCHIYMREIQIKVKKHMREYHALQKKRDWLHKMVIIYKRVMILMYLVMQIQPW